MPTTKVKRTAKVPRERRPIAIRIALARLAEARDIFRACGCKKPADKTARVMKAGEGALRHAEGRGMEL